MRARRESGSLLLHLYNLATSAVLRYCHHPDPPTSQVVFVAALV